MGVRATIAAIHRQFRTNDNPRSQKGRRRARVGVWDVLRTSDETVYDRAMGLPTEAGLGIRTLWEKTFCGTTAG